MKTFEECKQEVAKEYGFESFWHLEKRYPKAIYGYYEHAARMYANQSKPDYSPEYLDFIKKHGVKNLTGSESELLQVLVKHKIGGFEKIVKLYRDCVAGTYPKQNQPLFLENVERGLDEKDI